MKYNFNKIINRKNTNCEKHDYAKELGKAKDLIPLWVADMDFQVVPEITKALKKLVDHGIYGYTDVKDDYFKAVEKWFLKRLGFRFQKEWLVKTSGVIFAISTAIKAATKIEDAIMIQPPVYYPFRRLITLNKRKLITNPLVYHNGKYSIDFDDFEKKIIKNKVKLFILCSPHNPVGRVWTKAELTKIGNICLKHKVLVVSDEIHCDFVYPGFKHTVFSSINKNFLKNSIVCTSPSKTFNLAGLQTSNTFIADENLRNRFKQEMLGIGSVMINKMGLTACKTAYESGAVWVDELKIYLAKNIDYIKTFLNSNLPEIKLIETQGTYLVWLDCKALNLSDKNLQRLVEDKAKLWLDEGPIFGKEGSGFIRINVASPLAIIKKAMRQLKKAIHN